MNFHEVRFPTSISIGSSGGPQRRTEIVTLSNGYEERNSPWAHSRRRYDAGLGMRSLDDLAEVIAFFEARHGQLYGFRWKDWADFKSCEPSKSPGFFDQELGRGDGKRTQFPVFKSYASGDHAYERRISKPVEGTLRVAVAGWELEEGRDFGFDVETRLLRLSSAPQENAIITAGFEFDVPVRFATDQISANVISFSAGEIPSIPIVEVLL